MQRVQKGFAVLEALLVLVIIGLIGGVGWYVYQRSAKPKTADEVLVRLTDETKKQFAGSKFESADTWAAESSATAFNEVEGYNFAVSGAGKGITHTFDIDNSNTTEEVRHLLVFKRIIQPAKNLDQVKDFVENRIASYGFIKGDDGKYAKSNVTCEVLNDRLALFANIAHEADEKTNQLEVRCFSQEELRQIAQEVKPFVDEYLKAGLYDKENDGQLTVGPLVIKSQDGSGVIGSSQTAGYDIAEVMVATNRLKQIALYYAKDGQWKFVTQANDEWGFSCLGMKQDPDARKAFYNQICLGDNGQVRLDTNNRALP